MKTRFLALILAAGGLSARAQTPDPVVTPSPAPAITAATPAPNRIIHAPRLPTVNELTAAAAAQHLTIAKIETTATQVTVVYQAADGSTNTVAYQSLQAAAPTVAPPPAVVYEPAPRVVYYDSPYYYGAPFYWYPPVSLRLGFGYRYGGGFHHRH